MLSQSKNMLLFVELKRESCGQKVSEQIAWRRSRRKLNHQGKAIFQDRRMEAVLKAAVRPQR